MEAREKVSTPAPESQYPAAIMFNSEDYGWVRLDLVTLDVDGSGRREPWYFRAEGFIGISPRTAADLYHARVPRVRPVPAEDPDPIIDHDEAVYLARRVREEKGFSDPERYAWAGEILEHDVFTFKELTRSEADRIRAELATVDARLYTLPSFTRTAPRQRVAL